MNDFYLLFLKLAMLYSQNLLYLIFLIKQIPYMERGELLAKYQQYEPHFNEISQTMVHEPNPQRRCTDGGCVAVIILILIAFIGIGGYQITQYGKIQPINAGDLKENEQLFITQHIGIIAGSIATSFIVSYLYVFLLKMFPKPMVYFMIVLSMGTIAALALLGLFTANLGLAISMGVTFLIYGLLLCCLWKKLHTGIAMISVATKFMSDKPTVFLSPIVKLILTTIVGFFYVFALSATVAVSNHKQSLGEDSAVEDGFIGLYALFFLVFMFLFYYMMTYTISVMCANWYYGIQGSQGSLFNGYKMMFQQFGSLVFASLIISVVTFARMLVQQKRRQTKNIAEAVCLCILQCLLKAIQDLIKVLNHFTVIVLTLTGQSYLEGARSTMGLLWKQLPLLSITNLICNFLVLWGLIISVGIPSVLSYLLICSVTTSNDDNQRLAVVGLVAICSALISTVIFEILVESVSCIFIYYAIDKSFMERGLITQNRIQQNTTEIINRCSVNPYSMDGGSQQQGFNNDYNRMKN